MSENKKSDNLSVGARGGAIAFTLKIVATAMGFLNQIVLARILGAGGVGEVILAITVVRIAVQIAKFGMEETMMRFVPVYIDRKNAPMLKGTIYFALKFCLLISVGFALIIFLFSKVISIDMFHSEGLVSLLPLAAVIIPAWVIKDVIAGVLRGYKDTLSSMIPEALISPFFRLSLFVLLILWQATPLSAVIAFLAGELLALLTAIVFLGKKLKEIKSRGTDYEGKKLLSMAYTIIFTGMSVLLYTQADVWILGMFTSTDVVGIYGIAAKLALLVYFPMLAFAVIVPPLISSIHASRNTEELRRVIGESTRWILSLAMPIIILLLFEGKYILQYAYGPEFAQGYTVLIILTIGQMIKAGAGLIGVILQMTGEHKIYMKINIAGGILNIVLNTLLIPLYGMVGAAIATALCLSLIDIFCIFIIYKRLKVLTLAKGWLYDAVFITSLSSIFVLLDYYELLLGQQLLIVAALTLYLGRALLNNHIPLKLLMNRYREG